jgi:hypothetical protein
MRHRHQRLGVEIEKLGVVAQKTAHEHHAGERVVVVALEGLDLAHGQLQLARDVADTESLCGALRRQQCARPLCIGFIHFGLTPAGGLPSRPFHAGPVRRRAVHAISIDIGAARAERVLAGCLLARLGRPHGGAAAAARQIAHWNRPSMKALVSGADGKRRRSWLP